VLRLAQRGEPVVLPRAGKRDWLYARDAAAAIDALLDQPHRGHTTYNLAAGFVWSVADWCELLARRRPGFRWRLAAPCETPNVDYYAPYDRAPMDAARLQADTGFVPRYGLASAAGDFHEWLSHA
jgi:UDP-glucuronate 4-epimerase